MNFKSLRRTLMETPAVLLPVGLSSALLWIFMAIGEDVLDGDRITYDKGLLLWLRVPGHLNETIFQALVLMNNPHGMFT